MEIRELKGLLTTIDQMDCFQIRLHLNRFFVNEVEGEDLPKMKLQLKQIVLEEILKEEVENKDFFNRSLELVSNILKTKYTGYRCCYIGCRFHAERHRTSDERYA